MCDYSLMNAPNRLAIEGEDLVIHRFPTGSLGLASPVDVKRVLQPVVFRSKSFWARVNEFFSSPQVEPICAVCVPPGTRLRLADIAPCLQSALDLGPIEDVTFTQLSVDVNAYRDAVRFSNGRGVLLQELNEGQRIRALSPATSDDSVYRTYAEQFASAMNR